MNDIYSIDRPPHSLPLIFDSPHSGTDLPPDFKFSCTDDDIKETEDRYVDDLFDNAATYNTTLLRALFPRAYIDVNRSMDDIDPALLDLPKDDDFDWSYLKKIQPTQRSASGIGLIRRLVKPGLPLYDGTLGAQAIMKRIETYYIPYHQILSELLEAAHYNYGQVWLVDCHSMPVASAVPKRAIGFIGQRGKPVDICLGNRDGTTCSREFTYMVRDFFKHKGYSVSINDPFKGVELVERYGAPAIGRHALQLEINRGLYMRSETRRDRDKFDALKADIDDFMAACATYVAGQLTALAAD
jgi:N-formylglutamate deformylase